MNFAPFFLSNMGMIVFALFAAQLADTGNAQRHNRQRRIDLQRCQRLIGKCRPNVRQPGQAQIRLVEPYCRIDSS